MPSNDRERQDILNQPWEFEEALLSPKELARVRRAAVGGGNALFEQDSTLRVTEFKLRVLAVRLRTINNACDSGAVLSDGRPLTEVSLYGSRDRQYLVAPYFAVRRLMKGILPYRDELNPYLEDTAKEWGDHVKIMKDWWALLKKRPTQPLALPWDSLKYFSGGQSFTFTWAWRDVPEENRVMTWRHLTENWKVPPEQLAAVTESLNADNPFEALLNKVRATQSLESARGQWWYSFLQSYEPLLEEFKKLRSEIKYVAPVAKLLTLSDQRTPYRPASK